MQAETRELNLGTVWNEWNNNWSSVDIVQRERWEQQREEDNGCN